MHSRGRRSGSDHDWTTGESSGLGMLSEGRLSMRVYDVPLLEFCTTAWSSDWVYSVLPWGLGTRAQFSSFSGFRVDG